MKILLVTEKFSPNPSQRDGGSRLVNTIKDAFSNSLNVMQFGQITSTTATWNFDYPFNFPNRFKRRLANSKFIAEKVKSVEHLFTHIIFIHVSMQFGLVNLPLRRGLQIWTFPMFLTPSYVESGETVPENYQEMERLTLAISTNIVTPSLLEKRQLVEIYAISEERIHMIPRGVDTKLLMPKIRSINGPIRFCSIGSIKPQKNTMGLIQLFSRIQNIFPEASLQIAGPIQNFEYFDKVSAEIKRLNLSNFVGFSGYIFPENLSLELESAHFHLSTSTCETFGRSIFETLASGIPNIARKNGNAAAEFLEHLPYVRFTDSDDEALDSIKEMIVNFSKLSSMALEIGSLYTNEMLSQLIVAKISNKNSIAVSDFDGTLFHKNDPEKTRQCIEAFNKFQMRIICSARSTDDLLREIKYYDLDVEWIVSYSGAVVTNGKGVLLWRFPLHSKEVALLTTLIPQARCIEQEGEILQISMPTEMTPQILGLRIEKYQDTTFIISWEASKLKAIHKLLCYINWSGQVCVFGDGPYDAELLTYFDGTLIKNFPTIIAMNERL
ncbi:MAG: glycosyltransferase (plasmid) [Candidatus Symbiodolus clandestinus]